VGVQTAQVATILALHRTGHAYDGERTGADSRGAAHCALRPVMDTGDLESLVIVASREDCATWAILRFWASAAMGCQPSLTASPTFLI
jgi:hypothetical protein